MKFSIITATLNSERTIGRCIRSIDCQNYENWEHLIVDGGSKDKTCEIVGLKFSRANRLFIEGQDDGVYEAWNKAIRCCTGDWILFLGSDDYLYSSDVLQTINDECLLSPDKPSFISGKVMKETFRKGKLNVNLTRQNWLFEPAYWDDVVPQMPPHPGLFHSKTIFQENIFDEKLKIAADKLLFLQNFHKSDIQYIDKTITYFSHGGLSNTRGNNYKHWSEKNYVRKKLNIPFPLIKGAMSLLKAIVKDIINKIK